MTAVTVDIEEKNILNIKYIIWNKEIMHNIMIT